MKIYCFLVIVVALKFHQSTDTLRICSDLFQGEITMTKTTMRSDYKGIETFSLLKLNNIRDVIFVRK
jgi:hypothetical protein